MRLAVLTLAASLLLATACSGDDDASPTPTLFPELEASPGPTSVPPPVPTPCTDDDGFVVPCDGGNSTSSMAWIVDVESGSATPIYDGSEDAVRYADFNGDIAVLGIDNGTAQLDILLFDLEGNSLPHSDVWAPVPEGASTSYLRWRQTWFPGDLLCTPVEGGIEVDGRRFEDADCGPMSPDGRWMLYRVDTGPLEGKPYEGASWDEWLLDLETGDTRPVQAGLEICLGDSFFGPSWSPRGRYVFFGDCEGDGRIFLADAEEGTAHVIVEDLPTFRNMPDWAVVEDAIVYPDGEGGAVLEYLDGGTAFDPGVQWPARFGARGRYLYAAPAGATEEDPETLIFNVETGQSETLPGTALYRQRPVEQVSVKGTPDGYVAALEGLLYCRGMQVYVDGTPLVCVAGAQAPSFAPSGGYVAFFADSEIVVVDTETGAQRSVVNGVRLDIPYPIPVVWNDDGVHILVRSPQHYGPYGP